MDIDKLLNDRDSEIYKRIHKHFEELEKKWQDENPCPNCGSHNTHCDISCINGAHSSWDEWCDDCGWKRNTSS